MSPEPRAYSRHPITSWCRFGRESRNELCGSLCIAHSCADLPSNYTHTVACSGAGTINAPRTRPRTQDRVPDGDENYFGFGLPAPVSYCLECTPYTSTLLFDDALRPGYFLEWDNFPYPPSLKRGGRYFGEVWMTVAFAPARGARWGTEYCETHIDAHFGVYRSQKSRATGAINSKFVGLVPPEHKNPGLLYESYQVQNLRKYRLFILTTEIWGLTVNGEIAGA